MTYRYFPDFGLRVLQLVFLCESLMRGVVYLTVPRQGTIVATDIESSAPVQVWGIAFCAFAVLGLFGEALMSGTKPNPITGINQRAWPSFIAHSMLVILYSTLALAYVDSFFDGNRVMAQAAFAMMAFGVVHWLFARRRKRHAS